MSLNSLAFFPLLALAAAVYLKLPARWQTPFLLACSAAFYAKNLCSSYDSALAAGSTAAQAGFRTAVSACFAVFLVWYVYRRALRLASAGEKEKSGLLRRSVILLLGMLAVFKYYNLSPLPTVFAGSLWEKLPFPLGISFFTFTAIGYLIDVSRGDCAAEQSPVNTAVFLLFFGTVTSGPICRGGDLLPQLREEHRFEAARTVNAMRLFALGLFRKVAIADVLALAVNVVFADMGSYGALTLLFALVLYTLQLYFDFSGYSDMARAVGLLMGLELPENFKTPFFATNFSGFWSRWHISLSAWLQDYLFMTLAWLDVSALPAIGRPLAKKWPRLPVEVCVFTVFFLSGLWHGNTLPFVVWGCLQGIYRVGEELLHRRFGKPKKKGVKKSVIFGKRAAVFVLWTFSMLFFRVGSGPDTAGLSDCGVFLAGLCRGWSPLRFAAEVWQVIGAGFYDKAIMQLGWIAFVVLTLCAAFYLDWQRFAKYKGKPSELVLAAQKPAVKWLLYYLLVVCILVGFIMQNGGFGGGTSFAYAGF